MNADADELGNRTLELARRVADCLAAHSVDAALIGAGAMAVRGYARSTDDLDLAVEANFALTLRAVQRALQQEGLRVDARAADADDPLGGVLDVFGSTGAKVQVVNFNNDHNRGAGMLPTEAIRAAEMIDFDDGIQLKVVRVEHLVALKLYAGGVEAIADVARLLEKNPGALSEVEAVCTKFGYSARLQRVIELSRAMSG